MKRLIASLAAAGVLVAGAFVAVSVTGSPADAQEEATIADEGSTDPGSISVIVSPLSSTVIFGP